MYNYKVRIEKDGELKEANIEAENYAEVMKIVKDEIGGIIE